MISPATVARHVANIMIKLGFRSRAQIAAWVTEAYRSGGRPATGPPAAASPVRPWPTGRAGNLPALASSTVSSAAGSASSRWSGIGLPLSTERP